MIPAEDPDFSDLGPAFPAWMAARKDAILQPPKPEITPRSGSWNSSPNVTETWNPVTDHRDQP